MQSTLCKCQFLSFLGVKNHSDVRDTRTESWILSVFQTHLCRKTSLPSWCALFSLDTWLNPGFDFHSLSHAGIHSNLQLSLSELLLFKLGIFLHFRSLPSRLTKRSSYETIMNNIYNLCYSLLSLSEYTWFHLGLTGTGYNNRGPERLSNFPNVTQLVSDRSQTQFFSEPMQPYMLINGLFMLRVTQALDCKSLEDRNRIPWFPGNGVPVYLLCALQDREISGCPHPPQDIIIPMNFLGMEMKNLFNFSTVSLVFMWCLPKPSNQKQVGLRILRI